METATTGAVLSGTMTTLRPFSSVVSVNWILGSLVCADVKEAKISSSAQISGNFFLLFIFLLCKDHLEKVVEKAPGRQFPEREIVPQIGGEAKSLVWNKKAAS